jgi:hypothetical protein
MRTEYRQQLPPLWFWQDGPMQYHFVECVASVEIGREVDPKLCMLHGNAKNCTAIHACLIAGCPYAKARLKQWEDQYDEQARAFRRGGRSEGRDG